MEHLLTPHVINDKIKEVIQVLFWLLWQSQQNEEDWYIHFPVKPAGKLGSRHCSRHRGCRNDVLKLSEPHPGKRQPQDLPRSISLMTAISPQSRNCAWTSSRPQACLAEDYLPAPLLSTATSLVPHAPNCQHLCQSLATGLLRKSL